MKGKIVVPFRMDPDMLAAINRVCKSRNLNRSVFIRRAIEAALATERAAKFEGETVPDEAGCSHDRVMRKGYRRICVRCGSYL